MFAICVVRNFPHNFIQYPYFLVFVPFIEVSAYIQVSIFFSNVVILLFFCFNFARHDRSSNVISIYNLFYVKNHSISVFVKCFNMITVLRKPAPPKNPAMKRVLNKTPAEERDIFRPELFYNYINLRLKNN